MSAAGVPVSTAPDQGAGRGSSPTAALQLVRVRPISSTIARELFMRYHYLHSLPGGTKLTFGAFEGTRLMGALALGAGPFNAHSVVQGATPADALTLTRLWLSDKLPHNSESRVLGVVLRTLERHTNLKFLVTYADPLQGHLGTIYQATNWIYTGLSDPTPLYDLGDGKPHHSRTLGYLFGTRSVEYFSQHGVEVTLLPQSPKHRYIYFLNPSWRCRLRVPVLHYPKKGDVNERD